MEYHNGIFNKRNYFHSLLFFLICCLFLASCNHDSVYENNQDLESRIWKADSAIKFNFQITDAATHYDIYYNFRNTISYPFQNLYVNYNLKNAKGDVLLTELNNMNLFDLKTGKPYGKGLGDIYSHEFKAVSDFQFPDTGTYSVEIQQFMRKDTLPEIVTVGLSIKKFQPNEK